MLRLCFITYQIGWVGSRSEGKHFPLSVVNKPVNTNLHPIRLGDSHTKKMRYPTT